MDRRRTPRTPVDFVLNLVQDGMPMLCVASDITPRGMKLRRLQQRDTKSPRVDLEFLLPGGESVIVTPAAVRHSEGAELRVSFGVLTESTTTAIERFCDEHAPAA